MMSDHLLSLVASGEHLTSYKIDSTLVIIARWKQVWVFVRVLWHKKTTKTILWSNCL